MRKERRTARGFVGGAIGTLVLTGFEVLETELLTRSSPQEAATDPTLGLLGADEPPRIDLSS